MDVDDMIAAIRGGDPVLLPTDTVYGLATSPECEEYAMRLYRLKGRTAAQPTALLAAGVETLLEQVPELRGRGESILRELLPGPYTVVLPNPARRFGWLTGDRPDTIGVRAPVLPAKADRVLAEVGCVLATSANDPGGPSPATLSDVPERIRSAVAATLDAGRLPGVPSTVIDFTGPEPRVIREGAAPAAEAVARVRSVLSG